MNFKLVFSGKICPVLQKEVFPYTFMRLPTLEVFKSSQKRNNIEKLRKLILDIWAFMVKLSNELLLEKIPRFLILNRRRFFDFKDF